MKYHIINAKFLTSSSNLSNTLESPFTQVAFLGRSNVGKSTLINALCNNKNLAKSSSTPGKTRLVNFFEVTYKNDENDERTNIIFTDLPGFGYARVSKSLKKEWDKNLDAFLKNESKIKLFLHLIDSRHYDLEIDKGLDDYLSMFLRGDQIVLKVFTKCDKLNQSELARLKNAHQNALFVSSKNKKNIDFLQDIIFKKALGYDV